MTCAIDSCLTWRCSTSPQPDGRYELAILPAHRYLRRFSKEYFKLPAHTVRRFRWICYEVTMRVDSFDRGLGARKQGHDRSMADVRGTALRRACRMPQGEPDGGSEGRVFRSGRSPRDGPGRGGQARHDRPNC